MTRSRYPKNESVNRILRTLEGKALEADNHEIPGEVLSENEALSDISELLDNSLPNETLTLPASVALTNHFATVAEANAGVATDVIMSPAAHSWAHEFGGIWSTGTVSLALPSLEWTKLTGMFQSYTDNSGGEINCDWNDDRIIVNETGSYLILWRLSMWTWTNLKTKMFVKPYNNGAPVTNGLGVTTNNGSGTVVSLSGFGVATITSGVAIDLRINLTTGSTVTFESAQLFVQKQVG